MSLQVDVILERLWSLEGEELAHTITSARRSTQKNLSASPARNRHYSRAPTQHFQSSQEVREQEFNSIWCAFLHPPQKQMLPAELQLLRKMHLGNQDGVCA